MRTKISIKLILAVAGVAALIMGIVAFVVVETNQRRAISDLERSASQLSETVKSSTRYDMLLNQTESVHQIINTIGRQEGIEKVRVFNKEGEIILSTDTSDTGELVDMNAEACYACHAEDEPLERVPASERTRIFEVDDDHRMLGIINPIYNEPSCWEADCHAHPADQKVLGVLDITMPLDAVDAERQASEARLLWLTLLAIGGISILLLWLTERIVLKPVAQIVEGTRRVAAGDLGHSVPVKTDDEIGQLARSFNDMTRQLAEAQRQLFQSDKLASVGRLAAGVAHEINNPLTGVLTYSSFLLRRLNDRPEVSEDLEVIVRETKRCREIVKGLLDFARQSPPEKRRVDVNEVTYRAASIVHNQFALDEVSLELDLHEDLPPVHADVNQLEQVLVNLLVNANDALEGSSGTVRVATGRAEGPTDEEAVRITVSDTGRGIPEDDLGRIFDPFFSTKGQKGTGLGLAIVWGIVKEHGGRINVESEVERGTTFEILLPVGAPEPVEVA